MIGDPCNVIGLVLFGWSTAYQVHWVVPTVAEGFFGFGNMLIFMSCMMYITETYGPVSYVSPLREQRK